MGVNRAWRSPGAIRALQTSAALACVAGLAACGVVPPTSRPSSATPNAPEKSAPASPTATATEPVPAEFRGWYALDEVTDPSGRLIRLTLRVATKAVPEWTSIDFTPAQPLPQETQIDIAPFVSGSGPSVLVAYSDGLTSIVTHVSLTDLAVTPLELPGLVHHALEVRGAVFYVRIDPVSRQNIGIWRRTPTSLDRVAERPAGMRGDHFSERLAVTADGRSIVDRYCTGSCVVRVIPVDGLPGVRVGGTASGDWAGVGIGHAVFGNPCSGACGWQVVDLATGKVGSIGRQEGPGIVLADPAGDLFVHMSDRATGAVSAVRLPDGEAAPVASLPGGSETIVPVTDHQGYVLEAGQILTAPDGQLGGGADSGQPAHILDVFDRRLIPVIADASP